MSDVVHSEASVRATPAPSSNAVTKRASVALPMRTSDAFSVDIIAAASPPHRLRRGFLQHASFRFHGKGAGDRSREAGNGSKGHEHRRQARAYHHSNHRRPDHGGKP